MPARPPETDATGYSFRIILLGIVWSILLSSALGLSVKYGIELSRLVTNGPTVREHTGAIRVGVFNWAGFYPLVIAKEMGYFEKYGVDVELVKADSIMQLNDWIRTGRTQVSVGVLADFIILRGLGTPIQMMTATDYSLSDVVLGSPKIKSPQDLTGRRIGLSELSSFAEYFVIRSLELSGVNPRTVKLYTVAPTEVPNAILKGEIDAGHTWDPALAEGLRRGLKPVLSSAQNPRLVLDGIAFRIEVAHNIETPIGITRAFFDALALQKKDPIAFAAIPAKYFGITSDDAQRFIDQDARFADLDENIRLYHSGGLLRKEAAAVAHFFNERGMGADEADLRRLIDDTVIRRIEDERAIGAIHRAQPGMSTSRVDWQPGK